MPTTTTETMKVVQMHSFGGPEVLRFEDAPRPEPGSREVLVRVVAAGVNPADWKFREGKFGQVPLPAILGGDFSGEIEALGPGVEEFRVGEQVFGSVANKSGSYAQYAIAPVSHIVEKPKQIDHVTAAAIPVPAMTAWQALFDEAKLNAGQKVLIHAASGGVGNFAVQFAKWKGAHVIGTASGSNAALVRSLARMNLSITAARALKKSCAMSMWFLIPLAATHRNVPGKCSRKAACWSRLCNRHPSKVRRRTTCGEFSCAKMRRGMRS